MPSMGQGADLLPLPVAVPVPPDVRGGQGQAEPVPLLPLQDVHARRHEEARRPERARQDQHAQAQWKPGGRLQWQLEWDGIQSG